MLTYTPLHSTLLPLASVSPVTKALYISSILTTATLPILRIPHPRLISNRIHSITKRQDPFHVHHPQRRSATPPSFSLLTNISHLYPSVHPRTATQCSPRFRLTCPSTSQATGASHMFPFQSNASASWPSDMFLFYLIQYHPHRQTARMQCLCFVRMAASSYSRSIRAMAAKVVENCSNTSID